jgi:putative superfamily III holin-X
MVDQATMTRANGSNVPGNTGGPGLASGARAAAPSGPEASAGQVVSNVADFGENLLNLAELQARMSAMELRQNLEAVKAVGVVFLIGTVMALAALPVILAGVAELLVTELTFRRGSAFLTVGFSTIGIAAFCVAMASVWIRRKRLGFPLSAEEFNRNLNWVRTVIRLSGRMRGHQRSSGG